MGIRAERAYAAEDRLTEGYRAFLSIKEAAQFIRHCERDVRFNARWPEYRPIAKFVRKREFTEAEAHYRASDHSIGLNPWGWNNKVLLHELAHAIARNEHADHGPIWAGTYLELIGLFMSEAAKARLQLEYDKHGVVYKLVEAVVQ